MDKSGLHQLCHSLIKWIQTFKVSAPSSTVEELSDGVAVAHVLAQIAPDWFDTAWLSKIKSDDVRNWRLKVSNLRKILEGIMDYHQEVLGQQIPKILDIQLPAIGERNDPAELGKLLQLILHCAVHCDHKQEYIKKIMCMEEADQLIVMNAIQEVDNIVGTTVPGPQQFSEVSEQVKKLTYELESANEENQLVTQRCHELDLQVQALQDELGALRQREKEQDSQQRQTDISALAVRKLQHQVEQLKEELFKLEASRDEYRIKSEELTRDVKMLQVKNDDLHKKAEEARLLKDDIDVLRDKADKVLKYETMIEAYKKKLEDASDTRKQVKILEEKNVNYMQTVMDLEEELKKASFFKSQVEVYKKQVHELHNKLSEESKKADKADFENKKLTEKLGSVQREKERLIAERDTLKETNEELKLTQMLIGMNPEESGRTPSMGSDSDMLEIIPPQIKEKLIRLQHENKMLKLSRQGSDEQQTQVLQNMLDDSHQRENELTTENRLANQRLLELESQLEDLHNNQSDSRSQETDEFRKNLKFTTTCLRNAEVELQRKAAKLGDLENQVVDKDQKYATLQDTLNKKEEEMRLMEERYKKYLEKAKSVINALDLKQNYGSAPEVLHLRNQVLEKDALIRNLQRDSETSKALRESEERLISSAFFNLGKQLQRKAAEDRLASPNTSQTFLSRQRQATSHRLGMGLAQSSSS